MRDTRNLVWQHLSALPAFRALIRSIEHRLLAEYKPFRQPILDVGAGDGHFAAAALGPAVDVGVDVSVALFGEARQRNVYRHLVCGSATAMPFPSEYFATIVSNCVIEHIPDLRATLREIQRTLRPDGLVLLTVPTDRYEQNLLIPRVLRMLGLNKLADRYASWFRNVQVHYHLLPQEQWVEELTAAGLQVIHQRRYMSARATGYFELMHYAGWPNLLSRRLTGTWVTWPWRPRFALLERWLARFVIEPEHATDSCLFLVAKKA